MTSAPGGTFPSSWVKTLARSCSTMLAVRPSTSASSNRSRADATRSTSPTIRRSPMRISYPDRAPSTGSGTW
jgi:hypothetical protein